MKSFETHNTRYFTVLYSDMFVLLLRVYIRDRVFIKAQRFRIFKELFQFIH